ncbi:MAG: D-tyrosyl-tRNA(Tyr) deacylase [Magnetococcales bacterium]|nr:D-tyrosyl-tRNA(Tyr) deacylase [Magnetococcales bacterium]
MKAVVQRVREASVQVGAEVAGAIGPGLLVLLAVERGDGDRELELMARKIAGMRVFADANGRMNLSLGESGGALLVVSQFTLAANLSKGMRPSFERAEEPESARRTCERFCQRLEAAGIPVSRGRFGADMRVALINDGPVTFVLDFPPPHSRP